jgi:TPR repeat protein
MRVAEPPALVAGELETELRRALHRQQGPEPRQQPEWDPIFQAQELRSDALMPVPYGEYNRPQVKRRGSTARNILAVSLSAVVVGLAVQQIGYQWRDSNTGGGGGGGGNDGGKHRQSDNASIVAAVKPRDSAKLVQTGYAIQPLINPPASTDVGQPYGGQAELKSEEKAAAPQPDKVSDAAAAFRRDMEEARKLFEDKPNPVVRSVSPATVAPAGPAARPAAPPQQAQRPSITTPVTSVASVAPSAREAVPATSAVTPAAVNPSPKAGGSRVPSAEENKLLQRATDLMQRGDITGARLLFEHLARRGSPLGAFALAQSYDSKHLKKLLVRGLAPDDKQADYWYRKAAELGNGQKTR